MIVEVRNVSTVAWKSIVNFQNPLCPFLDWVSFGVSFDHPSPLFVESHPKTHSVQKWTEFWKFALQLAAVTSVGRRYQMCGAANTKARLPTVGSLAGGSTRWLELVERRIRLLGLSSSTRTSGPRCCGACPWSTLHVNTAQPVCTVDLFVSKLATSEYLAFIYI